MMLRDLRWAGKPLSAKDLAGRIIAKWRLNTGGPKLRRQTDKRLDMAPRYQRTNGMVREVPGAGDVEWGIA